MTNHIKPKTMDAAKWEALCQEASIKLAMVARYFKDNGVILRTEGGCCDLVRVGFWVWAEANSFDDFKINPSTLGYLKGMGFKPSPKRNAYAWTAEAFKGKRSRAGLDSLAQKYGYEIGGI